MIHLLDHGNTFCHYDDNASVCGSDLKLDCF